ncbi:MAG TPA: DNA primase catalytic subunit PriS [Thermoplasmatales archaeon]|nr:DNA primase catalytic subunit PriS [Thermoplasmatales archaeon]
MKKDSTMDSICFMRECFREWYKNHPVELPDRFGRREFAFTFFGGKGMLRHLSFSRKKEFNDFLVERAPAHIYYSSAYYRKPDAPTMSEKKWMGAELIFDLDADHLPDADKLSYEKQLEVVKKEFIKLVEDFLLGDFGFGIDQIELYFSGGRGYHCHVKDPRVLQLGSSERREIVDYIIGRDIREDLVFQDTVTSQREYKGRRYPSSKTLHMVSPDEPGWKGRISRGLIELVEEILSSDNPIEKLKGYGISRKTAEKLLSDLSDERVERIKQGRLDQSKTIRRFFLNNVLRRTAVSISAGETDEPVTCDVKRLIRLPFSLHGKTGFQVTKVSVDELKTFNPLVDAVVLPSTPVNVELHQPMSIKLRGENFKLVEGEEEVPMYVAVFLVGRGIASISS